MSFRLIPSLASAAVLLAAAFGSGLSAEQARGQAAEKPAPISAAERREQLAKVTEDINSPDPLKRLTMLDDVLHGNDPLARQIATQAALGSSDAAMRRYAALLILSRTQIMNLELSPPPEVQAKLDKAGDEGDARSKVEAPYAALFHFLSGGARHVTFQLHDFNADTGQFKVACQGEQKESPTSVGQVNGGSLGFRGTCTFPTVYVGDCTAALQLGAQGSFTGTLACINLGVPMLVTLRLY